eukprot:UN11629
MILSNYATIYNIKFYIVLRAPSDRTWSNYWMFYKNKYSITDIADIHRMANLIDRELTAFSADHPKYQSVLHYISCDNYNRSVTDYNEQTVVALWIKATYNVENNLLYHGEWKDLLSPDVGFGLSRGVPFFMISCYYPQLLMWYHVLKKFNVEHRIKILHFETILNQNTGHLVFGE